MEQVLCKNCGIPIMIAGDGDSRIWIHYICRKGYFQCKEGGSTVAEPSDDYQKKRDEESQ